MRKTSIDVALAATLMSACVVGPYDDGYATVVAPPLPLIVELGVDPFYAYGGFHYHYDNGFWRYARNRSGPWIDLPRSHYPRETRYHGPRDRELLLSPVVPLEVRANGRGKSAQASLSLGKMIRMRAGEM